ncbi:hypothetical protein M3Y97_00126000 [Aphelenchoides bicaudatus]|nr:hypothetical protein M3Y97_00126000 [Aphelenchoides bicaudatus]
MVARLSRLRPDCQSLSCSSNTLQPVAEHTEMETESGEWLLEQHVRESEQESANNFQKLSNGADRSTFVNQEQFDRIFNYQPAPECNLIDKRKIASNLFYNCTGCDRFFKFILSFFPILQWLPSYPWKQNLMGDAMAGLTIGVVHVPQGIAYAVLSGLEPVYGLYTSFFGVIFYALFGTSRFVSIGSFAVVALMTGVSVREIYQRIDDEYVQAEIRYFDETKTLIDPRNYTEMVPKTHVTHAELVQLITFTSGLVHLILGVLRVEFLASYLSDQLVNGFCTGAAVHVVVVQLGKLLEIPVTRFSGPGYLLRHVYDFAKKLPMANPTAAIISLASFIFLYIGKDHLNIYVLIPTGLPIPKTPRIDLIPYVFGDALEIAFVVIALHLSMCRLFNRRMGTKTNNNQELYAIGLMSSLSSFFTTYPVTSAIGRTMLNIECGVQTQVSGFFTASFLLIVILFVGPLLAKLPMCVLAVIIIYSMKNVFLKMPSELMHLWSVARIDFLIWIVAFISTAVLNVMQGLAISVIFALLTTVFRIQWPRWRVLSRLSGTEEYRDAGRYGRITNVEGIRIFRFDAPLLYTNVEHFAKSVEQAIQPITSVPIKSSLKQQKIGAPNEKDAEKAVESIEEAPIQNLIIDCSGFTFIDLTSATALADIYHQMQLRDIQVYFAGAKAPLRDTLEACGFYESVELFNFYPTVHDAVNAALAQKVELAVQAPPDPLPTPSSNQLNIPPPVSPMTKSARSLVANSFVSIQSIRQPCSENGGGFGSTRRLRSPTNWSINISPLTRDGRSGSVAPRLLDELDDL